MEQEGDFNRAALLARARVKMQRLAADEVIRWLAGLSPRATELLLLEAGLVLTADEVTDLADAIELEREAERVRTESRRRATLNRLASHLSEKATDRDRLRPRTAEEQSPAVAPVAAKQSSLDVFLVHGRDDSIMSNVARMVERIGLQPIILREQVGRGQTLIEKLEAHSGVRAAIVLLTPDDIGALDDRITPTKQLSPRPRQNVIYELGLFDGKLGRRSVVVLSKAARDGVPMEIPSDRSGVPPIRIDDNGLWKYLLARELQAIGFSIDLNRVA